MKLIATASCLLPSNGCSLPRMNKKKKIKQSKEVAENGKYLLSNHLESYFRVRLKLYSLRPDDILYKSVRKITVSALVNSALVPEYYNVEHRTRTNRNCTLDTDRNSQMEANKHLMALTLCMELPNNQQQQQQNTKCISNIVRSCLWKPTKKKNKFAECTATESKQKTKWHQQLP